MLQSDAPSSRRVPLPESTTAMLHYGGGRPLLRYIGGAGAGAGAERAPRAAAGRGPAPPSRELPRDCGEGAVKTRADIVRIVRSGHTQAHLRYGLLLCVELSMDSAAHFLLHISVHVGRLLKSRARSETNAW
ncbi:hypothetical protein PsYK624_134610 [Phanerochaete sordida]|uniref:Uncharacterized protein n=1 Tax=Phanerochaete sordida TaxID=48140 RepID=A0A9P3GPM1_9APHY|nr:hypothetical protein PsYK624_134610 [Phanerochaete sordida]